MSQEKIRSISELKEILVYLTRAQVAKLLHISLPTLNEYTKRGMLLSYRLGSKVLYKAVEVDQALTARNFTLSARGGSHAA